MSRGYTAKRADTFVACSWDGQATQALYHGGGHSESTLGFLQGSIVCVADPKTRRARLRIGTLKWAETVARQAAGTVWQTFPPLGPQ
jgi:hypothetical protein